MHYRIVFDYTGSSQSFTIPQNVMSLDVTLVGASGGTDYLASSFDSTPALGGENIVIIEM